MNDCIQNAMFGIRKSLFFATLAPIAFLYASASLAAPATLPDTPASKIGGELIRHINADTPEQIQLWAPTILSSAIDADDKAERHVFAPAGMNASGFDNPEDITPKLAIGHFRDGPLAAEWKADWMKVGFKVSPAGGGYSTNTDLLRFTKTLREGKLVKPATLTKMFDGEVPAGPGGYAAEFGDRLSHNRHIRGHAGDIEGTDANLEMVWGTNTAVALTGNEGLSQTWMLAEYIADLLAIEGAKP